jgi:hypothetical protein
MTIKRIELPKHLNGELYYGDKNLCGKVRR